MKRGDFPCLCGIPIGSHVKREYLGLTEDGEMQYRCTVNLKIHIGDWRFGSASAAETENEKNDMREKNA